MFKIRSVYAISYIVKPSNKSVKVDDGNMHSCVQGCFVNGSFNINPFPLYSANF